MSDKMPIREATVVPAEAEGGQPASIAAPQMAISGVADWISLLKPRVLTLVVFTGIVGMVVAPGHLHPVRAIAAILCIAAGAGAAGAINMWYDRDIDAVMRRTSRRPIPAGRIAPGDALGFGITLAAGAVLVMGLTANIATAAVLAVSIAFYVFIYTIWLKRRTPQNIVIGGAAGAFPPVIGWMAVTGNLGVMPVLMFAIIFLWTPPHFWSLSLWTHADYQRAGVPMLPVVAGAKETRRQIVIYTVPLVALSLLPWALRETSAVYGLAAAVLGLGFLTSVWRVARDQQDAAGVSQTRDAPARAAFRYSILYLFALFAALAVDSFVG
jgi:protoheme IX farnesyltransferase